MLLMTGEPNGSLSPQTGTAPSVVAEALEVGERKAKTKGRMQVSSQIIMSFETQAVICMQHSLPGDSEPSALVPMLSYHDDL